MSKAQVITIGTEITTGEIVNSNAAWVSRQLEELGLRVHNHLSVRDQRDEIFKALKSSENYTWIFVTGGLGPTSDDITRACLAEYTRQPLEFDEGVWADMVRLYQERGLPLREAHRHQCFFPAGAPRLLNPVGTALGFRQEFEGRHYFVLPGPPRELEGMWQQEVAPELSRLLPKIRFHWRHWTCLGAPESEVAELVEPYILGRGIEVGYRAAIPYVKVKLFLEDSNADHKLAGDAVGRALAPFVVSEGGVDLAEELLTLWPLARLILSDRCTENILAQRLFAAKNSLERRGQKSLSLEIHIGADSAEAGVSVWSVGEELHWRLSAGAKQNAGQLNLPYKIKLGSERGRLSAAEWVIWNAVKILRA